jgi:hypothetical protein
MRASSRNPRKSSQRRRGSFGSRVSLSDPSMHVSIMLRMGHDTYTSLYVRIPMTYWRAGLWRSCPFGSSVILILSLYVPDMLFPILFCNHCSCLNVAIGKLDIYSRCKYVEHRRMKLRCYNYKLWLPRRQVGRPKHVIPWFFEYSELCTTTCRLCLDPCVDAKRGYWAPNIAVTMVALDRGRRSGASSLLSHLAIVACTSSVDPLPRREIMGAVV